jgi:AAA domain
MSNSAIVESRSSEPCTIRQLIEHSRQYPLHWLVPDVILEDGVHVLHGHEESFKTMLTLQLHEALATGGDFLLRKPSSDTLRTGIAELEMKERLFGNRLGHFFHGDAFPDICVLPDSTRQQIIGASQPRERIKRIVDWANNENLQFVSIDSAVKLFPPGCDLSRADIASEVFSQLQQLPTVWIIAHDRKPLPGIIAKGGNAEIVGSGRFAQDPDVLHQMVRDDRRSPEVTFHWGKMREGEKCEPLSLFFDRVDYRLYPLHPYAHLLKREPTLATGLLAEALRRYGWHERQSREYLRTLGQLLDKNGNPCIQESMQGHSKQYALIAPPRGISTSES